MNLFPLLKRIPWRRTTYIRDQDKVSIKKRFFCPDFFFFTPPALLPDRPFRKISIRGRSASVRLPEIIITNGDCGPPRHCVSCSRLTGAIVRRRKILPRGALLPFSADRDAEIDCVPHAGDRSRFRSRLVCRSCPDRSGTARHSRGRFDYTSTAYAVKGAERKEAGKCGIGIPYGV